MYERILLMGGPDTGKTHQLICVAQYVAPKEMWVIDCEDKLGAFLSSIKDPPKNIHLSVATDWGEVQEIVDGWLKKKTQDQWIAIDRIDLCWPAVQRYYSQRKYDIELSERMIQQAEKIKKAAMFTPRFDQSDWQPVNEAYDSFILKVLLRTKAHVLLTAGVRGTRENEVSPFEVFGHLGVVPRGQKELPHQPHSAFLLFNEYRDRKITHRIITAKDLPGRARFDRDELFDFGLQYLAGVAGLGSG